MHTVHAPVAGADDRLRGRPDDDGRNAAACAATRVASPRAGRREDCRILRWRPSLAATDPRSGGLPWPGRPLNARPSWGRTCVVTALAVSEDRVIHHPSPFLPPLLGAEKNMLELSCAAVWSHAFCWSPRRGSPSVVPRRARRRQM